MKNRIKKSLKASNGITLIALVITIIVLLILAGISISMLSGDNGILQKATDAKTETEKSQEQEIVALAYNSALAKKVGNGDSTPVTSEDMNTELTNQGATASESNPIKVTFTATKRQYTVDNGIVTFAGIKSDDEPIERMTVAEAKNSGTIFNDNTILIDDYDNEVTVPKGFKIAPDPNGSATSVTDGIVIEDARDSQDSVVGSQFVWIPVGNVKKSGDIINIALARYTFESSGQPNKVQDASNSSSTVDLVVDSVIFQELATQPTGTDGQYTQIAKNLTEFTSSATNNHGYYLARYEASQGNDGKAQSKAGQNVWRNITQVNASNASRNMYNSDKYESDLVNSYAWDTAIVFIQTFANNKSNYANFNAYTDYQTTGGQNDEVCKINDMSGSLFELSTEYCTYQYSDGDIDMYNPCVQRGGYCIDDGEGESGNSTCFRGGVSTTGTSDSNKSFRSIVYLK